MSKATEQNEKLKRAIIISVALHVVLIALLVWSSFNENIEASGGGGSSDIDAVMVDPGAVVEQYNRQQNQQSDSQRAEQQRQKQAQQQAEELQHKQSVEQQRLKALEEEHLQAQQAAKEQAEAAADAKQKAEEQVKAAAAASAKEKAVVDAKAAADAKAKAAAEAKSKAAADAKAKAVEEAKEKAAQATKAKADAAAKAKAAADAKKKAAAEAAKNSSDVDDLLGGLTSGKNAPKSGNASGGGAAAGQGNQKKSGASGADISDYAGQIQAAIQSKFYDWENYKGLTCTLRIKLAPDGLLIDAKAEGGDPALCHAALSAARQARIPKPPSLDVYQVFKNAPLDFKPQ
ncbi:cell envelope integrity protein TolA [Candidatus Pantoea persica]|uniref:cell envelope integrity protein TolA n=1 Tax=Candidatus Pantoea persica TaxID=2518128 RepID=UPI00215D7B10|nr:cell envelope integrity protein TolA [Candidatus Pantoea persica]MBA2815180.1 putative cell envelope integrity inner membrane protein TolA [Candidatus Pantoea persica]